LSLTWSLQKITLQTNFNFTYSQNHQCLPQIGINSHETQTAVYHLTWETAIHLVLRFLNRQETQTLRSVTGVPTANLTLCSPIRRSTSPTEITIGKLNIVVLMFSCDAQGAWKGALYGGTVAVVDRVTQITVWGLVDDILVVVVQLYLLIQIIRFNCAVFPFIEMEAA